MDPGLDVPTGGSTLSLYDYEAALLGAVTYTVRDGLGVSTVAYPVTLAEYRRNFITDPRLVTASAWANITAGGVFGVGAQAYSPNQAAVPLEVWTVSADLTAGSTTLAGAFGVGPTTGGLFAGNPSQTTAFSIPAGTTVRVTQTATINAGADGLRLQMGALSGHNGTGAKIDRVVMEKGRGGAYFDGSTSAVSPVANLWTGSVNGSASVQTSPLAARLPLLTLPATATPSSVATSINTYAYRTNLIANPSLEVDAVGYAGTAAGRPGTATVARSTVRAQVGTASLLVTWPTQAGNTAWQYNVDCVIGKVYTASCYVWIVSGPAVKFGELFTGGTMSAATTGVWQRVSYTWTAYSTVHFIGGEVTGSTAGQSVHMDALLVEEGPSLLPYFDGATTPAGSKTYGWAGTAHASPSVETTTTAVTIVAPLGMPSTVDLQMVTDYDEASESGGSLHEIIGRSDPIANPGALRTRAGNVTLWCSDYTAANAVKSLLRSGETALLRQGDHPDLDLYFTARRVSLSPDPSESTVPRRWSASIEYAEVLAP
jgi:hypothetical protein